MSIFNKTKRDRYMYQSTSMPLQKDFAVKYRRRTHIWKRKSVNARLRIARKKIQFWNGRECLKHKQYWSKTPPKDTEFNNLTLVSLSALVCWIIFQPTETYYNVSLNRQYVKWDIYFQFHRQLKTASFFLAIMTIFHTAEFANFFR